MVFEDDTYLRACIRGLIDTDGSVYPKTRKHKTPSIWFCSANPQLREDFTKAIQQLDLNCSKWVNRKTKVAQDCSMGSKTTVLKYYQKIGFSNPKHEGRFKQFWTLPLPNT